MSKPRLIRTRLKSELERRQLTAVELARSAGVKTSFIYDILNGKSTNPSSVKLGQIADYLGINLAYLAGIADLPNAANSKGSDTFAVPMLQVSANGQRRTGLITTEEECGLLFSQLWIRNRLGTEPQNLRMVRIKGDAMAPTLVENDLVLVDLSQTTPSPPGMFVIFDGLGLTVKRLENAGAKRAAMLRLIADNTQYGSHEKPRDEVEIIGRVVWFGRAL